MSSISLFPFVSGRLLTGSLCVLSLLFSLSGCNGDELLTPDVPAVPGGSGHELAEGELCNVSLSVTGIPSIEEATTRSIPEGKHTVLMDFTNHELTSREGREAGWISTEVRTEFGEEERAATRAIPADKMFKDGSKFRMLVFKGPYSGTVNMETPVANMICQVNGSSAKFLSPSTSLGLLKGRYTFICFPADEKFNTWKVGEPRSKSKVTVSNDDDFVYCKVENKDMNTSSFNLSLNFTRKCYKLTVKLLVAEELGYIVGVDTVPVTVGNPSGVGYPIVSNATCDLYDGTMSGHKNELIESRIPVLNKGVIPQSFGSVDNMLVAPATGSTSKLRIGYPQITVLKPKGTDGSVSDSIFTIKAGFITTEDAFTFEANKSYTITLSIGEQVKGILVTFRNSSGAEHKIVFARSQLYYNKSTKKWDIGNEQCDYGYNENGVAPNTGDSKLVTGNINYYFMYGCLDASITANTGNGTNSEAGGMTGYYSGSSDLNTIGRDPCAKLGKDWMSPTRDIFYWMGYAGSNYYNGSSKSKPNTDYFPVDENGNRLAISGNPYFGTYTPTDSRSNRTAVKGMWIGLSAGNATASNNTKYNKSAFFLPAAGYRSYGGTSMSTVGGSSRYWSSQQYNSSIGQFFYFTSSRYDLNYSDRNAGFPVRCCLPE